MTTISINQTTASFTVGIDTPLIIDHALGRFRVPITIALTPGNSGTLLVEYQVTPSGSWHSFTDGNLQGVQSAFIVDALMTPVNALRVTATGSSGTVEIAQ